MAATVDEMLEALWRARDRDELLGLLVQALEPALWRPAVYSVHSGRVLRKRFELREGSPIVSEPISYRCPETSTILRGLDRGIIHIGPVPELDALGQLFDPLEATGNPVLLPVQVNGRTVCVVAGRARLESARLHRRLKKVQKEASGALAQLIVRTREQTGVVSTPTDSSGDTEEVRRAGSRDELVESLLQAATRHLTDPTIYVVQKEALRPYATLEEGHAVRLPQTENVVARGEHSRGWLVARTGRPVVAPLSPADALAPVHAPRATSRPVAVVPVPLKRRTVLLLVGGVRAGHHAECIRDLTILAAESARTLALLIVRRKAGDLATVATGLGPQLTTATTVSLVFSFALILAALFFHDQMRAAYLDLHKVWAELTRVNLPIPSYKDDEMNR